MRETLSSAPRAGVPDLPALPSECEGRVHHHLSLLLLLPQGKEKFLAILNKYMEIHGTVYYESQRPPEVPAFVKNHGLLPQPEFQQLLRKAKVRLWPLSYPCRPQSWMTGIYQARHLVQKARILRASISPRYLLLYVLDLCSHGCHTIG